MIVTPRKLTLEVHVFYKIIIIKKTTGLTGCFSTVILQILGNEPGGMAPFNSYIFSDCFFQVL